MINPFTKLLAMLVACFSFTAAQATHYTGWDLSYQCLGNNDYKFIITMYQDCHVGDPQSIAQDNPMWYRIYEQGTNNLLLNDSVNGSNIFQLPVNPASGCILDTNAYCTRVIRFVRTVHLPYSSTGYVFANQRCCLPTNISNVLNPGANGMTMTATVAGNGVCNNSAVFVHDPQVRFCINTPFEMNYAATDPDGDSLAYRMMPVLYGASAVDAKPLAAPPPYYDTAQYLPPYSGYAPMNGTGTFILDPVTGKITGNCHITGVYTIAVACDEYRNGTRINTNIRVFSPYIVNCQREVIAAAFNDTLQQVSNHDSLIAVQCGSNGVVDFHNHSSGATGYHWDFGDSTTAQDTSSLANPQYTYPATGTYLITLVAYGQHCNDTARGYVIISSDTVTTDFIAQGDLCRKDTILLLDNSVSTGSPIVQNAWVGNNGLVYHGNPLNFSFTQAGQQTITHYVTTAGGCIASISKQFDVMQANISAGNDTTVVAGTMLQLHATGGVSYNWSSMSLNANPITNTNTADPFVNCLLTGTNFRYIVTGTDNNGCTGTDSIAVSVSANAYVYVPTAFTPNGDGRNDVLKVFTSGCNLTELRIYSRTGKMIFFTTDLNNCWNGDHNGTAQPTDTYLWIIKAKDRNNETSVYKGNVTLLR